MLCLRKKVLEPLINKYVLRNPIAVNLCQQVEQYPYNLFAESNKKTSIALEKFIFHDYFDNCSDEKVLQWLNNSFKDNESKSIKTGLSKINFCYGKDESLRKEIKPLIIDPEITEIENAWDDFLPEETNPKRPFTNQMSLI